MIWFDLDNSPHVLIFKEVFEELKKRDVDFFVTARDFAQTLGLCKLFGIDAVEVGKHGGKNKVMKVLNLFQRARQLKKAVRGKGVDVAVSHGSRTQLLAAKRMRIRSLLMLDYEFTETKIFNKLADKILIPSYIPDKRLSDCGFDMKKVIRYKGFKEEIYLRDFVPEENFRDKIGVSDDDILVVIRPPSFVGNYHKKESESLFIEAVKYFSGFENVVCLLVSRTVEDRNAINAEVKKSNVRFLDGVVDGLQLVYTADVVLSGGGTMNRESALLGTKTYSIFKSKRPFLDEYLAEMGRLKFIESCEDFKKIEIKRFRDKEIMVDRNVLDEVVKIIISQINK